MIKIKQFSWILLVLLFCTGCRYEPPAEPTPRAYGPYVDAVSSAIISNQYAANAATSSVAQITLAAATEIAPTAGTEASVACKATVDKIKNGDYSMLVPGTQLNGCDLSEIDLFGMNLAKANLQSANLTRVNLTTANLSGADLRFALLSQTNLRFTNLSNAVMVGADLRGADLTGADLSGANLTGAIVVSDQLDLAANLTDAILPEVKSNTK